jgi:hypothetical protein
VLVAENYLRILLPKKWLLLIRPSWSKSTAR